VVIGLALAMSSTAVVIQVLSEEKRLNISIGRTSFAILLFQDLAVVPLLFVLGAIARPTTPAMLPASASPLARRSLRSPR
jgi:monovalent cation:H+ antiporter-2, CPA2 family